jgi:hypothetical protein
MLAGALSMHSHGIHAIINTHKTNDLRILLVLAGASFIHTHFIHTIIRNWCLIMYTHVNTHQNAHKSQMQVCGLPILRSCIWFDVS